MPPGAVAHGARVEVELVGDAVAHEHAALVVEDLAARRAHHDLLLVVRRGLRDERARVQDLQRPEPQHEQHEEHDDGHAERAEPQLQAPVARREAGSDGGCDIRLRERSGTRGSGNCRRGGALTPSARRSSASSGIAKSTLAAGAAASCTPKARPSAPSLPSMNAMPPSAMRTSAVASAIRRRLRTGAGGRSFSPAAPRQ